MYAGFQLMKLPQIVLVQAALLGWLHLEQIARCFLDPFDLPLGISFCSTYMETFILVIENISWFSCDLFNSKFYLFIMINSGNFVM
jgi:hypothetical protein